MVLSGSSEAWTLVSGWTLGQGWTPRVWEERGSEMVRDRMQTVSGTPPLSTLDTDGMQETLSRGRARHVRDMGCPRATDAVSNRRTETRTHGLGRPLRHLPARHREESTALLQN